MSGLSTSRSILITGSTSGIGCALALAIPALPHKPQVSGRRVERLAELQEKGLETRRLDLGNLDGLNGEVEGILESYPELDAVIFDAGIQRQFDFSKPESVKMENVIQELTVNYTSVLTMLACILPHFQKRSAEGKESTIIMITSGLSLVSLPTVPNYCATKAALHSFTVSLRAMLHASGSRVRVVEVYPPLVESGLHDPYGTTERLSKHWMSLEEFVRQVMPPLLSEEENIPVGNSKNWWERFGEGEKEELARARLAGR
ncbi:NAD(P)-binding protein [Cyathus striatus]|nr:NAD(P)-binding protein [Cyathus striatus]